ncbi:MAG: hypothetical protein LWW85_01020 [Marinilabiliales bacterium]|nr:hypothetical protein [Marinilabiliales bacterium]
MTREKDRPRVKAAGAAKDHFGRERHGAGGMEGKAWSRGHGAWADGMMLPLWLAFWETGDRKRETGITRGLDFSNRGAVKGL